MILKLGEGTTSNVYLGFLDRDPLRPAAIKIFKPEFLTSGEKAKEIFGNEIRALHSFDHPNIVKVYDFGVTGKILLFQPETSFVQIVEENLLFLSMEYVS
jgi:serine/threonine protein kinase